MGLVKLEILCKLARQLIGFPAKYDLTFLRCFEFASMCGFVKCLSCRNGRILAWCLYRRNHDGCSAFSRTYGLIFMLQVLAKK